VVAAKTEAGGVYPAPRPAPLMRHPSFFLRVTDDADA
jgi:hypothetical protein